MPFEGEFAEIPAGRGGLNYNQNPTQVPITDLIQANGVITQDGLLRKEPGAALFEPGPIKAQATLSETRQWSMAFATLKGSGIAYVTGSVMTSAQPVGTGPTFKVELSVPAGGISAGSCIVVSSALFTMRPDSTCTCTDDASNTYDVVAGPTTPPTVTRIFVALNVSALSEGQKITLTFDSNSVGLSHVAVANEFTGILSADALDQGDANDGDVSALAEVSCGPLATVPELIIVAGNLYDKADTTVTPELAFTKCGEATNGPGTTNNRGWQQYRIDTTHLLSDAAAPALSAQLDPQVTRWLGLAVSLRGTDLSLVVGSTITKTSPVIAPTYSAELTVTQAITAGDCIVVSSCLYWPSDDSECTCTDDAGNEYVEVAYRWHGPLGALRLFVAQGVAALTPGEKITLTFNGNGGPHVGIANEFRGVLVAGAVDKTAAAYAYLSANFLVPLPSLSDVPELLVGTGAFLDAWGVTISPLNGFSKCGDGLADGPVALRTWQEYRVDTESPTIIAMHDWRPTPGVQRIVTATLLGNIRKEVDGDLDAVELASGLSTTARPGRFLEGGQEAPGNARKLFYYNGTDPVQVLSGDGVSAAEIAKPAADWDPTWPVGGIVHGNRHVAFGNGSDPHRIYLSTLADHEDFQTNTGADVAYTFAAYPSVGEKIYCAAKHIGLLWLLKWPRGIFWLDDSDPDASVWSVQQLTDALGVAPTPYGALAVDNDVMFLAADCNFHMLSAVQTGVVRASNLSMAMHHSKWLRDNVNLLRLSQVVSVWYPHKKWAIWGMPSTGSVVNDLVMLFDFSEANQQGDLPRLYISHRDNVDAMALRLHPDQVERPMLGEGGLAWLLDEEDRNKVGAGYLGQYQTARTDFAFANPRFAAREKILYALELVVTPTSGTLTVDVEVDGTVVDSVDFDLSVHRQRQRICGSGFEISLIGHNSEPDVDFKIQRHLVFFREAEEGRI